jgi:enamine deaminase RidA (YjgF/YER057c/UK114 family)
MDTQRHGGESRYLQKRSLPELDCAGVNWLAGFDFEIKVVARIPSGAPAWVTRHNPPTLWDVASDGYSQISVAEPWRLAFLSGQVGWLASGGEAPNDIAGQAKIAGALITPATINRAWQKRIRPRTMPHVSPPDGVCIRGR